MTELPLPPSTFHPKGQSRENQNYFTYEMYAPPLYLSADCKCLAATVDHNSLTFCKCLKNFPVFLISLKLTPGGGITADYPPPQNSRTRVNTLPYV